MGQNNTQQRLTTLEKHVENIIIILKSKGYQYPLDIFTPKDKIKSTKQSEICDLSTKRSEMFLNVVCIVCAFIFNAGCLIKFLKLKNEMTNNLVSITMGFSGVTFVLLGAIKILSKLNIEF